MGGSTLATHLSRVHIKRYLRGEGCTTYRPPTAPGSTRGHYAVLGLVGNSGLVEPPDDLLHAILDAVDHVRDQGRAGKEIKGHRDGFPTDCPGGPLYAWVQRGAPRPGTDPVPAARPRRPRRFPAGC